MRDYALVTRSGEKLPIAEMPIEEVEGCLRDGVCFIRGTTEEAVLERLRLELFIRENNLREKTAC